MKIIVTGSLGNIGKPLTKELVQKGHTATVISSSAERQNDIEALGARAAIGSIEDVDFLARTFEGANIVFLMEPNVNYFDPNADIEKYWTGIARCYQQAIRQSGVTKVIHLSNIGAHTNKGVGTLTAHYLVEQILRELPGNISIKFMRPVSFYTNAFGWLHTIKEQGVIIASNGGDQKEPWVSLLDIACAIVEEADSPFEGRKVRYIASDEISPNEIAKILGEAVGKPELKWLTIPGDQLLNSLIGIGINPKIAEGFVEMQVATANGLLFEDYNRNKPALGKNKFNDFAKEFAMVYTQN